MKKNEEYILTCIDDTDLNSGVVKIDDMVVFVPNLLIGEKAKIKIVKVNKKICFWHYYSTFRTKYKSSTTYL